LLLSLLQGPPVAIALAKQRAMLENILLVLHSIHSQRSTPVVALYSLLQGTPVVIAALAKQRAMLDTALRVLCIA
jgi:hypothetical protein